jgi:hypothetical protein
MATKKVRCFTYNLRRDKVLVESKYLKEVINSLYSTENSKELPNGNKVRIFPTNSDLDDYISLEYIKNIKREKDTEIERKTIDDNFLFFRIGKQKDIEGAVRRNTKTWQGYEVIDKEEQDSFNLEICTYILVDITNGVILELFGKYSPTVKAFSVILNRAIQEEEDDKLSFSYNNIMTEELVDALSENGTRLGKIMYTYENPKLDFLKALGWGAEEINAVRDTKVFELELSIKAKGRSPLAKENSIIHNLVSTIKRAPHNFRKNVSLIGSTNSTASREYKFKEEEVTYNVDIPYTRVEDGIKVKLSLDEICFEVYEIFILMYNDNKGKIESYFKD